MARKKQEIALQVEIETQEEWEEMLSKEGLTVVDVYQEWCGPCGAMISNFRRLKNELGDDLLRFAVAKADTVDALERYRGRCQPVFLFFAGGILVALQRGIDVPYVMTLVANQVAHEKKVAEGSAQRVEIKDPLLATMDEKEKEDDEDDVEDVEVAVEQTSEQITSTHDLDIVQTSDDSKVKKGVTVAIIKPNVVEEGKVDEVMEKLQEAGIEILEHQEKQLTEEEAREFYSHKSEEEYFEDLVKFMSSGPSHILVLTKGETGEGIIEEWRDLLGPPSVEEAKEQAPDCLRAQYGKENYVNALHGSDSGDTAMKELAFFFPDFVTPTVAGKKKAKIQRTLALIRPDAMKENKDEILAKIEEAGFTIALQKEIQLSKEQVEEFYKEHTEQPYFEELITRMTSGPLLALALAREEAVSGWRDLLGPTEVDKAKEEAPESLRAQFSIEDVTVNQLHGSDNEEHAKQELEYFFPMQQTVAVVKPDAYQTKEEIMQKVREAGFHIAARKETELTKDIAEQFYKEHGDKEYYGDLTDHMASGPTLFMVLSREDAVDGWRSLIGPTDPEKAKEEAPDSLRAQFGTDIKANAIHGSSNPEHVKESVKLIFGDLEFNDDGAAAEEKQEGEEDDEEGVKDGETEEGEEQKEGEEGEEKKEEAGEVDAEKEHKEGEEAEKGSEDGEKKEGEGEDAEKKEGETEEDKKEGEKDSEEAEKKEGDDAKDGVKDGEKAEDKKEDEADTKGDDKEGEAKT